MTHTKYFRRIAYGLDVEPLLELLDARPELWDEITTRQNMTKSPHKDTPEDAPFVLPSTVCQY